MKDKMTEQNQNVLKNAAKELRAIAEESPAHTTEIVPEGCIGCKLACIADTLSGIYFDEVTIQNGVLHTLETCSSERSSSDITVHVFIEKDRRI